ncbi:MAG TPA: tetratricopeptide repeat protein [Woeseiaceae bacterium]|nr:tetratricopeptide repeat protein [Woeseiaceae bacterium]
MSNFIQELRRRNVFRVAGLYVGVSWILIEAASVLLPTFEAPEWALRWLVIITFIGFPVALILAWVFEITERGVLRESEVDATTKPLVGGRQADFIAIGVLSVALIFSVYLNITRTTTVEPVEMEPTSVLIADFENATGDPLFDGLLEQALNIGIESAPNITAYLRNAAEKVARQVSPDSKGISGQVARLIAVRQGIDLVLAGRIAQAGSGYELSLQAIDPQSGEVVSETSRAAKAKDAVLAAVGELSGDIREALGDATLKSGEEATAETFTAASIEAAQAYTTAIDFAYEGDHDEAIAKFREATEMDPRFGRAYSGWALSAFKLGRQEEAEELWKKALSLMDTMTERERLRTQGLYYSVVTGNIDKAIESFERLVEKYPADAAGHNNLAVSYFLGLEFDKAAEQGSDILEIYPTSELYRTNYALYAMYSGEFEKARTEAQKVLERNPDYGSAYLPLAIGALAQGEPEAAREAYRKMAEASKSEHGPSLAKLGLADIDIFTGRFDSARRILTEAIQTDISNENTRAAARKYLALAHAWLAEGQYDEAAAAVEEGLALASGLAERVPAGIIYVITERLEKAGEIADDLASQLQPQSRAYGLMLKGMIAREDGDYVAAVDNMREAIEFADLWLIHFELGQTYLAGEYYAEALDEFTVADQRRGEASAVFLDDIPTYRYMATMPYWQGRAQEALDIKAAAHENYRAFLSRWESGGRLVEDARQRLP